MFEDENYRNTQNTNEKQCSHAKEYANEIWQINALLTHKTEKVTLKILNH